MKIVLLFLCLAVGGIVIAAIAARLERASGGTPISIEAAPHFASLRRYDVQICGGSFISTEHVLTAAHCVVNGSLRELAATRVVSGTDKFNKADYGYEIENIFPHEGYLNGTSSCDIAIITLSMPVEWNGKQNPKALPHAGPQDNTYATFAAFKFYNTRHSDAGLRQLDVRIDLDHPTSNNTDDSDQVFYGSLGRSGSINKVDLGGALIYEERIIGVAFKTAEAHNNGCYFINVVKFKTFIQGYLNSVRPSVISWAPKRPRP